MRLKNQKLLQGHPAEPRSYLRQLGAFHKRVRLDLEFCHLTLRHLHVGACWRPRTGGVSRGSSMRWRTSKLAISHTCRASTSGPCGARTAGHVRLAHQRANGSRMDMNAPLASARAQASLRSSASFFSSQRKNPVVVRKGCLYYPINFRIWVAKPCKTAKFFNPLNVFPMSPVNVTAPFLVQKALKTANSEKCVFLPNSLVFRRKPAPGVFCLEKPANSSPLSLSPPKSPVSNAPPRHSPESASV